MTVTKKRFRVGESPTARPIKAKPLHSITSSARASSVGERPAALDDPPTHGSDIVLYQCSCQPVLAAGAGYRCGISDISRTSKSMSELGHPTGTPALRARFSSHEL